MGYANHLKGYCYSVGTGKSSTANTLLYDSNKDVIKAYTLTKFRDFKSNWILDIRKRIKKTRKFKNKSARFLVQ